MTNKTVLITGIQIDVDYNQFKMYQRTERWDEQIKKDQFHEESSSGFSTDIGISNIIHCLNSRQNNPEAVFNQFVIVYDVNCPNKEQSINKLLTLINKLKKNNLLPILVAVGHEEKPLDKAITENFAQVKEYSGVEVNNNLYNVFKNIIEQEVSSTKKEMIFASRLEQHKKDFTAQMSILVDKAAKLLKDGHIAAADKADLLCTKLRNLSDVFFNHPSQEAYAEFQKQTKEEIKLAHTELDKHRGWKRVLGNITLAILGFGVLYAVAVLVNRNLFFNKTDSAEKLDNFEAFIDKNPYIKK